MSAVTTYKLTLLDGISTPLRKVTTTSIDVIDKLSELTAAQKRFEGINNSLGGSIASLRSKMEMLRAERDLISPANTAEIKKYNVEIEKLGNEIARFDNLGVKNPLDILNASAIMDIAQGTADALATISQSGVDFEQGVADLSAITGIAGKDLDKLSSTARKVGVDSGLGASQAVEAYKLLASQIDVSKIGIDGLQELQKRTITLSQAGGLSMADAANAMAGTINQFGLEASEANRIINVLAAGSKYGAAEIPELAQSFKVVGAAANAAGLSVESTAGAIEVLSKNNLKGAEAGTALRNIVLKMQTTLGYDFSKTSLSEALADLAPKMNDAAYMSKIFGMENVAAAQFLAANAGAVQEMTDRVTDSNVAQEQAAIRTETMQAKMARFQARIDNVKIGLFDLTWGITGYASVFGEQMVMVSQMIPLYNVLKSGILSIAASEKVKAIATGISTAATKVATGATWLLNSALAANPIVWVVAGIAGLVATITICWQKFEGFRKVVYGVWGVIKEFGSSIINSVVNPFKQILKGIGGVCSAIVNLVKGNFKEAAIEAKAGFKDIGTGALNANPIAMAANSIKDGGYKAAWQGGVQNGRDSWMRSHTEDSGETQGVSITSPIQRLSKIPSRAAASIALPAMLASTSPAVAQPIDDYRSVPSTKTTEMVDLGHDGKSVRVEKVCDQVVIYVQNTDGKGAEKIRDEVLKILDEIGDE